MTTFGKKTLIIYIMICLCVGNFTGCAQKAPAEYTTNGFAFNTTYSITLYSGGSEELIRNCTKKCAEYEEIFSRTVEGSELYQINEIEKLYLSAKKKSGFHEVAVEKKKRNIPRKVRDAIVRRIEQEKSELNKVEYELRQDGSMKFPVSKELQMMLEKGLEYSNLSGGSFDMTIEPVTSLWDFTAEEPKVPDEKKLQMALPYVDYQNLLIEDGKIIFAMAGMGLDVGGIAKGYIADRLKEYLESEGVTSGLINLGGNILCIGSKPNKKEFAIGIQQPFADRNETMGAVLVEDMSVVSSGIYERYFENEGKLYHHILNPKTGYSFDNDLTSVTILSKQSVDGDGLSTICFSLGKDAGLQLVNTLEGVEALFISKEGETFYSDGFQEYMDDTDIF